MIDKTASPNPENVTKLLEDLKKIILNHHTSEVMVAIKFFNKFLEHPEYWASNWIDDEKTIDI